MERRSSPFFSLIPVSPFSLFVPSSLLCSPFGCCRQRWWVHLLFLTVMPFLAVMLMIGLHGGKISYHMGRIPVFYDWKSQMHCVQGIVLCLMLPKYRWRRWKPIWTKTNLGTRKEVKLNVCDQHGNVVSSLFLYKEEGKVVIESGSEEGGGEEDVQRGRRGRGGGKVDYDDEMSFTMPLLDKSWEDEENMMDSSSASDMSRSILENIHVHHEGSSSSNSSSAEEVKEKKNIFSLEEADAEKDEEVEQGDGVSSVNNFRELNFRKKLIEFMELLEYYPIVKSEVIMEYCQFAFSVALAMGYPIYNLVKRLIKNHHEFTYSSYAVNCFDYLCGQLIGIFILLMMLGLGWMLQRRRDRQFDEQQKKQVEVFPSGNLHHVSSLPETAISGTDSKGERKEEEEVSIENEREKLIEEYRNSWSFRSSHVEANDHNNSPSFSSSGVDGGKNYFFFLTEPSLNNAYCQRYFQEEEKGWRMRKTNGFGVDSHSNGKRRGQRINDEVLRVVMHAWWVENYILKPTLCFVSVLVGCSYTAGMGMMIATQILIGSSNSLPPFLVGGYD